MFIGREKELSQLNQLLNNKIANLVVIKGRRRIGKSRLIAEFAKSFKSYTFMGLPPHENMPALEQKKEFLRQLRDQFNIPALAPSTDWGDIFTFLANLTKTDRVIIVFDEISWMADNDPSFLAKLKTVWDLHFSKNPKLILILCGSVSAWLDKNILSNTGYLGRPNLHMTLLELPLTDCNKFLGNSSKSVGISSFEKFKILAITGGVPRYLELVDPKLTAEENIRNLCFIKSSPLYDEFKFIFNDIYGRRSNKYLEIITMLADGKSTRDKLIDFLKLSNSGDSTENLEELEAGGFIERSYTWSIKSGKVSNLSSYRLKDNYTRFYLKNVLPNKARIDKDQFYDVAINNLPGWNSILGLQFENLVLNNQNKIINLLGIKPEDIIAADPYFQRKSSRSKGCQIDYMIQTKHDTVYICEIKFARKEISKEIIPEVEQKLKNIQLPKYISKRAVLIHVNGVSDALVEEDYFTRIIDFRDFLL